MKPHLLGIFIVTGLGVFAAPLVAQQGGTTAPKVILAGSGTEPHIQTLMDDTVDFLKSSGVRVKMAEDTSKPRTFQVEHLAGSGAESLLYLTLDVAMGQAKDRFSVQCFDKDGKQLWKEEVGGGVSHFRLPLRKCRNL